MSGNPAIYGRNELYRLYGGNEPPFDALTEGDIWYVDGNLSASGDGKTWDKAFITIQEAVTAASAGDVVYVTAKTHTDYTGDPVSYAETIIIPYATNNLSIIGITGGRTQGGLPQIKKGSGSTALLTIQAPGCLIMNLGFNGVGSTGGGILLDDDYAAKAAFGTTITNCHFKNCKCHATNGTLGGAIYTTAAGNAWQVLIKGNKFYKNLADVVLVGTSNTVPQDWVIEDNVFSGPAANVDVNLWLKGAGSGINGVTIRNNTFQQLPAISSGSVARFIDATGCVGIMDGCTFGCQINPTGGTTMTFKAAGTAAKIPTTMHITRCFGQTIANTETGEISIA